MSIVIARANICHGILLIKVLPSPKIVKRKWSLGEYLAYPITPIRKGKRQTKRQPYAISSHNFKLALHTKQKKKKIC